MFALYAKKWLGRVPVLYPLSYNLRLRPQTAFNDWRGSNPRPPASSQTTRIPIHRQGNPDMPKLSASSQKRLDAAHPILKKLFTAVALEANITILDSQRGRAAQERAFVLGNSRAHFGQSAHNWSPALAMDVAPYPVNWDNIQRFKDLGVIVKRIAAKQGVADKIKWGATFKGLADYPHWEVTPWQEYAKKAKPFNG